ncbi:MAG: CCA tRNA nucleotidyltransferase [Anaerolineales bacterium]|nr:CCA tRNA nucleotidyltransferase [Anaerolineales bacterium]
MENLVYGLPEWLLQALRNLDLDEPVWLVGGAVRDWLLQRPCKDFDFVFPSNARRLARRLADNLGAVYYTLDSERDTGRVLYQDGLNQTWSLDMASLRGKSLQQDLFERDFTINALAVDILGNNTIQDVVGGQGDITAKVLRPCSQLSLEQDPVRVLRAVRIATDLGFHLHQETQNQINLSAKKLPSVSPERIRDELFRIFSIFRPARALRVLQHINVLPLVFSMIFKRSTGEVTDPVGQDWLEMDFKWIESFSTIVSLIETRDGDLANANLSASLLFNCLKPFRKDLAAYLSTSISGNRSIQALIVLYQLLIQGLQVPGTRVESDSLSEEQSRLLEPVCRNLRLSKTESDFLTSIHLWDLEESRAVGNTLWVHRLVRDYGKGAAAGVLVSLAWLLMQGVSGQSGFKTETLETAQQIFILIFKETERIIPELLLDGQGIMSVLDISPGPEIGRMLQLLAEAQVVGVVENEAEALEFLRSVKPQMNLWGIENTRYYQQI